MMSLFPAAPSMMSLRQRHIDPQLALGSQRLVESSLLAGQQGEGNPYPSKPRPAFLQSRSHSFGQLECLPLQTLSSAVSHPSVICSSNPIPQSLPSLSSSSSCLPSTVAGGVAHHSSHVHHAAFQPMDPIPDYISKVQSSCSDSLGYQSHSTLYACVWVFFFNPFLLLSFWLFHVWHVLFYL